MGNSQQRVSRQEYVVCHELVHLRVPEHGRGWQALVGVTLPGWREREQHLAGWVKSQVLWKEGYRDTSIPR